MGLKDKLENEGSTFQSPAGLGAVTPQVGATAASKLHDKYSLDGTDSTAVTSQINEYDDGVQNITPSPSTLDLNGNNIAGKAEGLHARIIQHEFDHLNGVLYTSRLAHKSAFGYSEEIEKFWKKNNDENKK